MEKIELIEPGIQYADDIWDFRQEILDCDAKSEDQFAGCISLDVSRSAEEWIKICELRKSEETCGEVGTTVPSHMYLAVRKNDNKVIGIIDLRHHINHPILGTWGGHCGYSVRPSERGKGYAKEMLRLNILNAKALGIPKLLITCDVKNKASEKTILANGGVYEKTIDVDGCKMKRYWIMVKNMAKKIIHIYGASGSGTTTLAKYISEKLNYAFMDSDDYFWKPTNPPYTEKREISERLELMKKDIAKSDKVVISGSLVDWGDELIPLFTLVIRLETATDIRIERLKRREYEHFGSRIEIGGDMYDNHQEFLAWAAAYDCGDINMRSKAKHDEWQKLLQCKQIILDGSAEVEENFEIIKLYERAETGD